MESAENRFAHLLQPIRELTKNWDVDVASELADYLEELDEMCISFDGGKTRLNFAEAALLIQGSTCIYSKKVEHLYNLVYQTMDYINDRNKKRDKQATTGEDGGAGGSTADHDMNDASGFDSLDQSVKEKSHQDSFVNDPTARVEVTPLPPESLIPPEAFEKRKLPLISLKGEVLCSCKDFRMNTFTPDSQGITRLFLPSARSNFLRDTLYSSTMTPVSLYQHQEYEEGQAVGDAGMAVAGGDKDEGIDGVENFLPLEENDVEMEQGPEEHIDRHQAAGEGMKLRERREIQPSEEEQRKQKMVEERALTANVWKLHDPYAVFGEEKPLKTGKCYRVPPGLDDSGKRKKKSPNVLLDFWSWYTGTYDPPEPKLKNGPSLTDLNYIYLSKMKDKLKTRKRIYRKTGVVVSDEELRRTYLQLEEKEEAESERLQHHQLQEQEDNQSDNEYEPLPYEIPAEFGGGENVLPDFDGMSYEDLVKKSVEQFLVNSQGYAQETALSRRVRDWEDKIRPELGLQEERPVFDIHDYGDRIVGALSGVGQRRSFASIVHGLDNFEACKYMLASLQLANDHTVEIDRGEGLEESIDTMGLTLLSKHRANERFKNLKSSAVTGGAV